MNTNSIEIVSIPELHRTQWWVDGETVARYMKALQNGEALEPVGCARCPLSGNVILCDGHNRAVATILSQEWVIEAEIFECDAQTDPDEPPCREISDVCSKRYPKIWDGKIEFRRR